MKCHCCGVDVTDTKIVSEEPMSFWVLCVTCFEKPEVQEWLKEQRGCASPTTMNGKSVLPGTHAGRDWPSASSAGE